MADIKQMTAARDRMLSVCNQYVLPDGTVIAHQNRGETEFIYREIFEDRCYFKNGIDVREGDCIFDVGANIGLFSLYLNRLACDLRVFAFEPLPPVYRLLRINRAVCGMSNVRVFQYGLSNQPGMETFTYYPHNSIMSGRYADAREDGDMMKSYLSGRMNEADAQRPGAAAMLERVVESKLTGTQYQCELRTLSQVIEEHRIARIDLLKLDVEKSELDVLRGIRDEDWPKIRQIVAEVYDGDGQLEAIAGLLCRHGFKVVLEQDECLRDTHVHMVYARRTVADLAG